MGGSLEAGKSPQLFPSHQSPSMGIWNNLFLKLTHAHAHTHVHTVSQSDLHLLLLLSVNDSRDQPPLRRL